jgi:hypothetical protein
MECHTEIDGKKLLVDFFTSGGILKGYRNYYGVPEEPDDEVEVEIVSIVDEETGDNQMDLLDTHEAELVESCMSTLESYNPN